MIINILNVTNPLTSENTAQIAEYSTAMMEARDRRKIFPHAE